MGAILIHVMPEQIKAVIVGDGAIGKSCLVDAIQNPGAEMSSAYKPTVAENRTLNWELDGDPVMCDFWDTAGQEQFSSLRVMAYNGANVIVVGFKMTDPDSLNNIVDEGGWVEEVEEKLPGFQHWILCGTQYDLWDKSNSAHCQEAKIHEVAESIGAKNVIYTSAFTKHNCDVAQKEICRIGVASAKGEPITAWKKPAPPAPAPAPAPAQDAAAPAPGKPETISNTPNKDKKDADKEGCECTLL